MPLRGLSADRCSNGMKKVFIGLALAAFSVIVAPIAYAVELPGLETTAGTAGIKNNGFSDPTSGVGTILDFVLSFIGVLFLILMIYGGFMWMTSAGNEERIKTATRVVVSAVIGLVIVLSAYAITRFVGGELLGP